MAIVNFPANPSIGDQYNENGITYTWNGAAWTANGAENTDARYVQVTGDTMTGNLNVPSINGLNYPTAGALSNRNLIINGGMQVAQRGTSFATAVSGTNYAADRWKYEASTSAVVTISQETDAPPGFTNSIKAEITTADTSTAAGAYTQFLYSIEANDISHLEYGTSNAKTCTISFWAKHKLPGTYPFSIQNHDGTRVYPASYTIQDADTWEYFSITFAGDTGGTWVTDGGALGMRFVFCWNMGSNFTSGTAGAWAATTGFTDLAPTTGPDVNGTVGNTVQWAGVQLEVGERATPFQHEDYGTTLRKCQRYAYRIESSSSTVYTRFGGGVADGASSLTALVQFPVTMRSIPNSITSASSGNFQASNGVVGQIGTNLTLQISTRSKNSSIINLAVSGGLTSGNYYFLEAANNANAWIVFDAEL